MRLWRTLPDAAATLPVAVLLDRNDLTTRAVLDAQEHDDPQVAAVHHPARRAEMRDRRMALRLLAAGLAHKPFSDTPIVRDDVGRPVLPGASLHLSLSSRGRWIALAAGLSPLGIDVEEPVADDAIPFAALHPVEAEALRGIPDSKRPLSAARLWAAKEAYWKARAFSTSVDPTSFSVTRNGGSFTINDPHHGMASGLLLTQGSSLPAVALVML